MLVATAVLTPAVFLLSLAGGQRHFHGHGLPGLRGLVLAACVGLGVAVAIFGVRRSFLRRCVPPASPLALGVIRCWTCLVAASVALVTPAASIVHAPTAELTPMGVMDLLYAAPAGVGRLSFWVATTPAATHAFQGLTAALLLLAAAGWRTRWTLPLAAVAYLVLGGIPRSHLKFFHAGLLPFFALAVLSFLPCADAFSLDARRRRRAGGTPPPPGVPTPRHGRARFLVYLAIGLPYAAAGLSKFAGGGLFWAGPHNQRAMLFDQSLNPMGDAPFLPLLRMTPGFVFGFMGASALLAELGMAFAATSRWVRRVIPPTIALMHAGTWAFMGIFFWESALLMAVFLNWRPLGRALRLPLPPPGKPAEREERDPTRFAVAAALLVVVSAVPWVLRTESYPLTAMQMFAGYHAADEVEHTRLFAIRASGAEEPAPFQDLGLLRLGRNLSLRAFEDTQERARVDRLLADAAAGANAMQPEDPIVRLELRRYAYPLAGTASDVYADPLGTLAFDL
ncbi:hypothetical membrane protein [Phycisphaera mikurensis NBRC 102666]|uniref:Hypothetical membrane protein n=2 Tax=Phycisphaera TaxID=666508 RepID=I0IFT8_PHYMF|nr:hypothetical membrane protein [Phycisphaera mikurensis NBRC 102666]